MEVTRENWEEALPAMRAALEEADFVAIDFEFSGLAADRSQEVHAMDSLQERYSKLRDAAQKLAVLQLGLCAFRWVDGNGIEAKPFNIFVFPGSPEVDVRFIFQSTSVNFLASCNFDFNKCFNKGMRYLNEEETKKALHAFEENVRTKMNSSSSSRTEIKMSNVKKDNRALLDAALESARDLTDQAQNGAHVVLGEYNSFARRIIYQEIPALFPMIHVGKFDEDNINVKRKNLARLRLTFAGKDVDAIEQARIRASLLNERKALDAQIGIGQLIEALRNFKKPIIAHNCFLDLTHFYEKFVRPLPKRMEDFQLDVHDAFPMIIDSKWMFKEDERLSLLVPNNGLEDCFKITQEESAFKVTNPKCEFADSFNRYRESAMEHEAGYDAFMTGVLFARGCAVLGMSGCKFNAKTMQFDGYEKVQAKLFNKLYLMRMNVSFPLAGPIFEEDRSTMLRLCNFPEITKTKDFQKLIQNQLKDSSYVRIIWESPTSAFFDARNRTFCDQLIACNHEMRLPRMRGSVAEGFSNGTSLSFADLDIISFNEWNDKGRDDSAMGLDFPRKRQRPGTVDETGSKKSKSECVVM